MNPSLPPAAGPFHVMWTPEHLIIYYQGPAEHAVYLALDHAGDYTGTSYIPFEAHFEGSTTYVATKVQRIYFTTRAGKFLRRWRGTQWGERNNAGTEFSVSRHAGITRLTLRRAAIRGIGSRVGVSLTPRISTRTAAGVRWWPRRATHFCPVAAIATSRIT